MFCKVNACFIKSFLYHSCPCLNSVPLLQPCINILLRYLYLSSTSICRSLVFPFVISLSLILIHFVLPVLIFMTYSFMSTLHRLFGCFIIYTVEYFPPLRLPVLSGLVVNVPFSLIISPIQLSFLIWVSLKVFFPSFSVYPRY